MGTRHDELGTASARRDKLLRVGLFFAWDWLAALLVTTVSTLRLKLTLRWLGCHFGRGLRADGRVVVRVRHAGAVTLGDNVMLRSRFMSNLAGLTGPTILHCIRDGRISIGNNSGCSGNVLSSRSSITIGANVNLGINVRIYDHDFHALDFATRRDSARDAKECRTAPVVIGNDAFIGANAIILKGVTIGDRSVVGAGSVVTLREVPPDSLVAGNPARIIRSLMTRRNHSDGSPPAQN
jgi:acetyltransferase-like isoleucine patch superfamily enzyme